MQVPATNAASQLAAALGTGAIVRITGGNLANAPLGELLQATVTQASPREAVLTVNGQAITVRPGPTGFPAALQPGATLAVRVQGGAATALEVVGQLPTPTAPAGNTPALTNRTAVPTDAAPRIATVPLATPNSQTTPARVALVDVLAVLPDGRVRVRVDGEETTATSAHTLAPGGRYVAQVERTPAGLALRPVPEGPNLLAVLAGAILRTARPPDLAATLKPLLTELTTLQTTPPPATATGTPTLPTAVRAAANTVSETIRAFLPADPRPPNPEELRALVADGGLHFEAKLARLVPDEGEVSPAPSPAKEPAAEKPGTPATPTTAASTPTTRPANDPVGPDLKGDLLRLLQSVQDLGAAAQLPAARATLNGIEAQQATNALSQANGTPYFLQVPFPDGGVWRTMHLSLEPERNGNQTDEEKPESFRMLMHVPLTDLGETWIDAGVAGKRLRAVMYFDQPQVRDRVRSELPALKGELESDGFSEVLLDVRSASDLPTKHRRQVSAMHAGRPESLSLVDVRV